MFDSRGEVLSRQPVMTAIEPPTMPQPGDLPPPAGDIEPADPAHADAVLSRLTGTAVTVASVPLSDAVHLAYDRLIAAGASEAQDLR